MLTPQAAQRVPPELYCGHCSRGDCFFFEAWKFYKKLGGRPGPGRLSKL